MRGHILVKSWHQSTNARMHANLTIPSFLPWSGHKSQPSTSELKKEDDESLIVTERSDVRDVEVKE